MVHVTYTLYVTVPLTIIPQAFSIYVTYIILNLCHIKIYILCLPSSDNNVRKEKNLIFGTLKVGDFLVFWLLKRILAILESLM